MVNKNTFREHLRLMTPMELCLCMKDEELITGFTNLKPDERTRFIYEFENELIATIQRFGEIKAKSMLVEN